MYLKDNQIHQLPHSFGDLKSLKSINLSDNKLTALPESFGSLTRLENLHIFDNFITHLPKSFQNLPNLTQLWIKNNPIKGFQFEMDTCPNLHRIDLSGTLFQDFSSLHVFPSLETVYFGNFQFKQIPSGLLSFLIEKSSLKDISLSLNQFSTYPREVIPILQQKIDFFDFQVNPFSLEERFFLEEIFAVEPSESIFEEYDKQTEKEKEEFYISMNQVLIQFLTLGNQFLPTLFAKLTQGLELSFLDYHHPDLLYRSQEIVNFCQLKATKNAKAFQKYVGERIIAFEDWKIEESELIERNFVLV